MLGNADSIIFLRILALLNFCRYLDHNVNVHIAWKGWFHYFPENFCPFELFLFVKDKGIDVLICRKFLLVMHFINFFVYLMHTLLFIMCIMAKLWGSTVYVSLFIFFFICRKFLTCVKLYESNSLKTSLNTT